METDPEHVPAIAVRRMTILLTGATGFIGARMAERLHGKGLQLTLLGRMRNEIERGRAAALRGLGLQVHDVDVGSPDVADHLAGTDVVIHLAAAQHEANQPAAYFERINVGGTRSLLEASVSAGVRRFVYGSTIGVYGQALEGELHERSPVAPDNHYGRTKLAAEQLVQEHASHIEVVIGRISEVYGPGDNRLLKLFGGIAKGLFFPIGPGRNLHQVIYVDDLVDGLHELGTSAEVIGRTLVLAGDEVITTNEMCGLIAEAVRRPLPRLRLPLPPFLWTAVLMEQTLGRIGIQPPLHRRRLDFFRKSFHFSPVERNRRLQWRPGVRFKEGARLTAEWYRQAGLLGRP